jgi:hypothetical protein
MFFRAKQPENCLALKNMGQPMGPNPKNRFSKMVLDPLKIQEKVPFFKFPKIFWLHSVQVTTILIKLKT